jgi:serine protease Do
MSMFTRYSIPLACCLALGCGATSKQADSPPPVEPQPVATGAPHVITEVAAVENIESAFKRAIAKADPAVVSIYSSKTVTVPGFGAPFGEDRSLERFFEFPLPDAQPREFWQEGTGSGFLIDEAGHILTNNHVIEGAQEIRVELADKREFEAQVVGADPATDLALLKIDAEDLHALEFGDSDTLEVGDWVLAIGNPFNLSRTVSVGIVSATGRANVGIVDYENFIQTDAAINPGSSGGPLVDLDGRVVGINTALASRGGGNNGIAFAVPVNMAKQVVSQLMSEGKVARGYLGISISALSPELAASFAYEGAGGILVQDVEAGGGGERAGLRHGDIITKLDGEAVHSVSAFRYDIAQRRPDASVELEVWRSGKHERLRAQLREAPGSASVSAIPANQPAKLGIELRDITPQLREQLGVDDGSAVIISRVEPGSPAAAAGLRPGDVLEQVGQERVHSAEQAVGLLNRAKHEGGARVRIRRGDDGRYVFIEMKRDDKQDRD